jgi:hypothetical protein
VIFEAWLQLFKLELVLGFFSCLLTIKPRIGLKHYMLKKIFFAALLSAKRRGSLE